MKVKNTLVAIVSSFLLAGCGTSKPTESALIGKWQSVFGGVTCYFLPNQSYLYSQPSPPLTVRGRYEVGSGNRLILTPEDKGRRAMQFALEGDVLNEIQSDGSIDIFKRAKW
jgi:hypothetical protein